MISVLIFSCDSYSDVWEPFFTLLNRYWECPYQIYIATETKDCEYATALKHQGSWTKRIRESLFDIPTEYVIIMCEDMFLQNKVKEDVIEYTLKQFKDDIATFNFELSYNKNEYVSDIWGFKIKDKNAIFKSSCQPGLWNKNKLIEIMCGEKSPWEWEQTLQNDKYKYYINSSIPVFDYNYKKYNWFGIRKGKWTKNAVELLNRENININFEERGIYDEN